MSARVTPAIEVIGRPLEVRKNSEGRNGAVVVQVSRALFDVTQISHFLDVQRSFFTSLDYETCSVHTALRHWSPSPGLPWSY